MAHLWIPTGEPEAWEPGSLAAPLCTLSPSGAGMDGAADPGATLLHRLAGGGWALIPGRDVRVLVNGHSAGLGLRVHTPYFLLRMDYGIKLDRKPGESFGVLYFSIGQSF